MSIERYRNDNPRGADEVAEAIGYELQQIDESYPVIPGTQNYAYIQSFARTIAQQQEQSLADLYDTAYIADATGIELTKRANEIGVQRQDAVRATGVVKFFRDTAASEDRTIPSGTVVGTGGSEGISFETTEKAILTNGTTSVTANVQASEPGPEGNVGVGTIDTLIESPAGIDGVTNEQPTGDRQFTLTDGLTKQTIGRDEENDQSLRERALESVAIGGAGTAEALQLALTNIEDVISADVLTNRSDTITNGVDPWHTEVRIYGGDIIDIAERLYQVLPINTLKSLQGGANGTLESTTIDGGELYGPLTIPITRPTEVPLAIDIDLVHDDSYAGTTEVKNEIVEYIGGTTTDERTIAGLGQGEDVIVNEIENVAEDVTGVVAVTDSLVDAGGGTDDTTTDPDGVRIYDVDDTWVATVDADEITVNTTAR